jgi:hypothetical protein
MPCTGNDQSYGSHHDSDLWARVRKLEAAMCGVCKAIITSENKLPEEMDIWYKNHEKSSGHVKPSPPKSERDLLLDKMNNSNGYKFSDDEIALMHGSLDAPKTGDE